MLHWVSPSGPAHTRIVRPQNLRSPRLLHGLVSKPSIRPAINNDCFCFHCRPSPIYLCHSGLHHNLQLDTASRSNNRPDPILSTHRPMDLHKHVSVGPCIHVYVGPCTDPTLTLASKTDRYLSAFGVIMKPTVPEMKER